MSVPFKKIVTYISHQLIVPLLWILWQVSISYCKFLMLKALKWGILPICTLVIHQNILKNKYKLLRILLSGTDFTVHVSLLKQTINRFQPVWQSSRQHTLRALCPNRYTVPKSMTKSADNTSTCPVNPFTWTCTAATP